MEKATFGIDDPNPKEGELELEPKKESEEKEPKGALEDPWKTRGKRERD